MLKKIIFIREYVEKNYIHKDKIREKIKKLDDNIDLIWASTNYDEELVKKFQDKIDVLDELLEETEDENNNTYSMQVKKEQSTNII